MNSYVVFISYMWKAMCLCIRSSGFQVTVIMMSVTACWAGHLACKNCPRNDLWCVECNVKPLHYYYYY